MKTLYTFSLLIWSYFYGFLILFKQTTFHNIRNILKEGLWQGNQSIINSKSYLERVKRERGGEPLYLFHGASIHS
jgi:F420-0:gamma-glutamyl ligase-like protein